MLLCPNQGSELLWVPLEHPQVFRRERHWWGFGTGFAGGSEPPSWVRMPWDAGQEFPREPTLRRLIWGRFGDFWLSPARQGGFPACLDLSKVPSHSSSSMIPYEQQGGQAAPKASSRGNS